MNRFALTLLCIVSMFWTAASAAAEAPRFFIMGTGGLALVNAHTDEKVGVTYRRPDGTCDDDALDRLRQVFRSKGNAHETAMTLRLVEVLSRVQQLAGGKPLVLLSGYRSPEYNESIRSKGAKAAAGSLHTEGLAADVAVPRPVLSKVWHQLRALECCGAGYYEKEGFLHVDVGRPRFWEAATSGVEKNLSASNARLFARTEYDRYRRDEPMNVTLHSLTVPPVWVARAARFETDAGTSLSVTLIAGDEPDPVSLVKDGDESERCVRVTASGASLRMSGVGDPARGRLVLATCAPRAGLTPETIETNRVEVR